MATKIMTAVGNAQIDTAQFKFGASSGLFDGTGDWLTTPDNADWSYGDFTIECWIRKATITDGGIVGHATSDTQPRWVFYTEDASPNHKLKFGYNDGVSWQVLLNSGVTVISVDTWYAVSFVRSVNDFTIYMDGTRVATSNYAAGTINMPDTLKIGQDGTGALAFNGWIDELRISKVARYTGASYTVPTSAFVTDSDTVLLLHCEGADTSTTFTDSSAATAVSSAKRSSNIAMLRVGI